MIEINQNATFLDWIAGHDAMLWSIARAYASFDERDELHQDLLIAVWHAVPLFRGQSKPSTFIYRVAFNRALNWTRNRQGYARRHVALEESLSAPAPSELRIEELYAALGTLPEADRSLALMYLDDLSYREMAEVLGITESNVGVKLNRIKKRLGEGITK